MPQCAECDLYHESIDPKELSYRQLLNIIAKWRRANAGTIEADYLIHDLIEGRGDANA